MASTSKHSKRVHGIVSAKWEKLLPILLALIAAVIAAFMSYALEIAPFSKSFAAGTMTFGIVVAGFSATQRNMLLAMGGSKVLRFAVRTGYHNDVLAYLMHCVYAGLLVSAVSVIGFFLGDNAIVPWRIWLAVLTFSVVLVLILILRNEIMIVRMVKRFMEDQHQNTK